MLFLIIAFVLTVDAVESNGWGMRFIYFTAAVTLGVIGGLMVLMTDKPLVIQWLIFMLKF